ncbi:MAG TPA: molybdenum cofactor biosynthesis protein [Idiomarina sp.]|nr:molybdenum cofactor biosynthesis protein [Idiomarina sp.]
MSSAKQFKPLNVALLTFSDKRDQSNDTTGAKLQQAVEAEGHEVVYRKVCEHNKHLIRAAVCSLIADDEVQVILTNGGTGFALDNVTQAAIAPLLEQRIDGFGELFRHLSYQDIGSSSLQSRAFAGITNKTLVACVPGSGGAAMLAWEKLLKPQMDARQGPCNFVGHLV